MDISNNENVVGVHKPPAAAHKQPNENVVGVHKPPNENVVGVHKPPNENVVGVHKPPAAGHKGAPLIIMAQDKLSKSEWESIEIPSTDEEKKILKLIIKGYHNVNIRENEILTIFSFLKLDDTDSIKDFIFMNYLQPEIIAIFKKYKTKYTPLNLNKKTLCKADQIRFANMSKNLIERRSTIFEFILIDYIENILKNNPDRTDKTDKTDRTDKTERNDKKLGKQNTEVLWLKYLYTLKLSLKFDISHINNYLLDVVNLMINYFDDDLDKLKIIANSKQIIIANNDLIKYADKALFSHQKQLFTRFKDPNPQLVFYIAPTGTGKTLSPLGLSEKHRIIFVCAVRHVGLALAKAAISMEKRVAFAFGCNDTTDIRLHYFSAKEYTKNYKTGGVYKVDNTVGDKVEIMICDIKSYLCAMNYMLAFNKKKDLILYWDEPTISLDYEEHEFHSIIKNNWTQNLIPNIVLSSATLPQLDELTETINDYKGRFGGEIHYIKNYDCSKSISLVNRDGFTEAPHYLSRDYQAILDSVKYIETNKTILRYVDLNECVLFIKYVNKYEYYKNPIYSVEEYFKNIEDITVESIKLYYLLLLRNIKTDRENDAWAKIYAHFQKNRTKTYNSTAYISTTDAHTLVNGPTIYITQDVNKIGFFCIQSMNLPENIIENISNTIVYNSEINSKISVMEKDYEDGISKDDMKEKKAANERGIPPELRALKAKIDGLKGTIKTVSLDDIYIPNTKAHLYKWHRENLVDGKNAFASDISDYVVEQIMGITDMDDIWKLLLLMGIGVFSIHTSSKYTEIMKDLAKSKKLYLIIASSDFIYGTNYQFDHCYLGKDLLNMTQEKIIQALGRVGRNKISDEYTIRIRDDTFISKIFSYDTYKPEVVNMRKLFS